MTKKIVVADDSTTIRGVAESLLRQRGYEVYTAPEGEAAFSLIEKIHPDLVLLDYSMPEPNGLDLCKRMRDKGEYKETPIIILANAGDSDKIMDFVECGATGTLVKPFTPRELNETVDDYFTRDSAEESESVKADIEMQHSLIGIDDGQNVNKDSADPSDSSEDLHEEAIKEFAKSDSSLSESSFALMEQKGDSDELDFSWSDLSLDLEEFVNEDEDSASIDDRLLSDKQSSNDDTDSITRFLDSSEKPPEMEGNMPHDYNWFINEMRKEIKDTDNTVADSEKLNTSDSDDVDAAQDVSAESSQIGVKATEQYEEFISAFRDDIRGITESDQESPEIPIEEYPSAEEVLSTQDDKSIDIEPEITEEEDFILSDHEPLAVGDIQIDDSQITDEDELSEIPEEFTKLELPEDSEEQVLQEEETFSDEKQEVQDSVAEDIETEPLTEALERDREDFDEELEVEPQEAPQETWEANGDVHEKQESDEKQEVQDWIPEDMETEPLTESLEEDREDFDEDLEAEPQEAPQETWQAIKDVHEEQKEEEPLLNDSQKVEESNEAEEDKKPDSLHIPEDVLRGLAEKIATELADKLAKQLSSHIDNEILEKLLRENLDNWKDQNPI